MAATEWSAQVKGFGAATYKAALVASRIGVSTSSQEIDNATTGTQYAAAAAAVDALIGALGTTGNFIISVNGYEGPGQAGSGITVSVHKR